MKKRALVSTIIYLLILSLGIKLRAQTIADTVKKEQQRAGKTKPANKSFTEDDLKSLPAGSSVTSSKPTDRRSGNAPQSNPSGTTIIPIERQGTSMVVSVELNSRMHTKLIVDTGASITSISRSVADQLGIKITNQTMVLPTQTANGPALVPLVKLRSLRVGDLELNDVDVLIMNNWPNPEVTGLLGMNFFGNFDWSTDTVNNQLILKPHGGHSSENTYGGYGKEWWIGRFRFLEGSLEHLRAELKVAETAQRSDHAAQIKATISYLEDQLQELNRQANQVGVPREFRK